MSATVAIVQRRLTHYRVPLFEQLRQQLFDRGVTLRLLHGEPTEAERSKRDGGHLDWAEHLPTRYLAGGRLMWQPFAARTAGCDMVIVTQENKHLHNLPPLLTPWRRQLIAFWGHGRNLQALDPDGIAERFKRWTTPRVDWWFAYTELSAGLVRDTGFPSGRITVLDNSIDTSSLRRDIAAAAQQPAAALREDLGLPAGGPLAVFIGSLYADKRIGFLLDAVARLRDVVPGLTLAIAGDGPERERVRQAAAPGSGVHWLGAVHGLRKAQLLAACDVVLNPGLVGLGILDAFAAARPLVTTDCRLHSPEIAYLEQGVNGLMTADRLDDYVAAVRALLDEPARLRRLGEAAAAAGERYTVEHMAERFSAGILQALAAGRRRP